MRFNFAYDSFSSILRRWSGGGEITHIEERLISIVEVRLFSPTSTLDFIPKSCTLNERIVSFKACKFLQVTQYLVGFSDYFLVQKIESDPCHY